MANQRRGGIIQVLVGGISVDAKGEFSYDLGLPKREAIVGQDNTHGYKEMPKQAFIEGVITDSGSLDLAALVGQEDVTITVNLANGKTIMLGGAWFAGDGTASTAEGEIQVRWESTQRGKEI